MFSGGNKRLKQFYQTSSLGLDLVKKHNYSLAKILTIFFKSQVEIKLMCQNIVQREYSKYFYSKY